LLENYISTHGKRPSPQNGRAFLSGNIEKELWGMEKTFQYHQQIFAGLELEIYNDLLKKDKIFLQCGGSCCGDGGVGCSGRTVTRRNAEFHSTARMYLD
jgi:hypothetical protein